MSALPEPSPNVLAGLSLSLDRCAERREDSSWLAAQEQSAAARYLLLDETDCAYFNLAGDQLRWLDASERSAFYPELPASFLGCSSGSSYFALSLGEPLPASLVTPLAAQPLTLRQTAPQLSAVEAGLYAYAKGLSHWQRETRHCPHCGAPLQLTAAGHRLSCQGADCGRQHFPRTDPAIIVIVEYQGACLLGRQARWKPGHYSTLAGFVEPGEALEDAVRREVAEEAGVKLASVHYHSSQPWPMPASLMLGFTAVAATPDIRCRDQELEDARWFTPQQIVAGLRAGQLRLPGPVSVSYRLIAHWLQQHSGLQLHELC